MPRTAWTDYNAKDPVLSLRDLQPTWWVPDTNAPAVMNLVRLTPEGWAALYLSPHHRGGDTAALFEQNWNANE